MAISSFRDLRVWQAGMDLVELVYRLTEGFPPKEIYGLTGQMRRCAISVPSNIAEGHTREHSKEYLHHISMAQASLAELQTQLEIVGRLNYLSKDIVTTSIEHAVTLGNSSPLCGMRWRDEASRMRKPQPLTSNPQPL